MPLPRGQALVEALAEDEAAQSAGQLPHRNDDQNGTSSETTNRSK